MPAATDLPPAIANVTRPLDDDTHGKLRTWNIAAGLLHSVSAALMVLLGNDFELPITLLEGGQPGAPLSERAVQVVTQVPIAPAVAAFMALSALFHFLVASPVFNARYRSEIEHGRNRFRWVEYALSSTLMIVIIALLVSLDGLGALIGIAFANIAMILFGWVMEMVNGPEGRVWWSPFWFGTIAATAPWLALTLAIVLTDGSRPPTFVYGILISIFLLFNCFAVNQFLQYRRVGKWESYVFGEQGYIILSFVAKSALAWQIFANTLIPE